ncbi:MAG: hypothetical protein KDE51_08460 [Anaerolineales bacterium]|nr:hypothetical protein [Anaerolineales bacterium]
MSRKKYSRVRYTLDAGEITALPSHELAAVLRAADELIMTGGRSLLTKILKGSRDKKLLTLNLDQSPMYGYYSHLTLADIQKRVDWVILEGYLAIEYELSIPLLRYTTKGWAIERETFARELFAGFDQLLASGATDFDMLYLKDRARDMIMILLDMIEESGDPKYIPVLEAWAAVDYKKVRQRIAQVIESLSQRQP